jgi:hypothetical protein
MTVMPRNHPERETGNNPRAGNRSGARHYFLSVAQNRPSRSSPLRMISSDVA